MKETGTRKYHHNTVRVKEPQTVKYSLNSSEVEEIFFQCKHVLDQRFNTLVFNQNFFSLSINQGFKTKASTYRKRFFIIFYLRTIQGFLRSNKKKTLLFEIFRHPANICEKSIILIRNIKNSHHQQQLWHQQFQDNCELSNSREKYFYPKIVTESAVLPFSMVNFIMASPPYSVRQDNFNVWKKSSV